MANLLLVMQPAEAEALSPHLQAEGFAIERAMDSHDAVDRALTGDFALVILEVSRLEPNGVGGVETLRRIRQRSLLPALMISAEANDAERILALELGADDYLRKPYLPQELMARARAILRRAISGVSAYGHLVKAGDLELDKLKRKASKAGVEIALTSAEFDMLELLLRRVGQVVMREEIARAILGRPLNHNDRSVDMHVSNLRRKLGEAERASGRIKAIRGAGYSFTIS